MTPYEGVEYWFDENLSAQCVRCFSHNRFSARRVPLATSDPVIIRQLGETNGAKTVLFTRDLATKTSFPREIADAGICVAWLHADDPNRATQLLMMLTFAFRFHEVLAESNEPLYFDLQLAPGTGPVIVNVSPARI